MRKKTFEELNEGDKSQFAKTITEADLFAFTGICGDFNPLHTNEEYAKTTRFKGRIVHGMLVASLIDYTLTDLVGLGGVHISQFVRFSAPVKIDDTITVESTITQLIPEKRRLRIQSTVKNQNGLVVLTGETEGLVPL